MVSPRRAWRARSSAFCSSTELEAALTRRLGDRNIRVIAIRLAHTPLPPLVAPYGYLQMDEGVATVRRGCRPTTSATIRTETAFALPMTRLRIRYTAPERRTQGRFESSRPRRPRRRPDAGRTNFDRTSLRTERPSQLLRGVPGRVVHIATECRYEGGKCRGTGTAKTSGAMSGRGNRS